MNRRAPLRGDALQVGEVFQAVEVGAEHHVVDGRAGIDGTVDAEGVDADAADVPPLEQELGCLRAEAGKVVTAGSVKALERAGVVHLARPP